MAADVSISSRPKSTGGQTRSMTRFHHSRWPSGRGAWNAADAFHRGQQRALEFGQGDEPASVVAHWGEVADLGDREQPLVARVLVGDPAEQVDARCGGRRRSSEKLASRHSRKPLGHHRVQAAEEPVLDQPVRRRPERHVPHGGIGTGAAVGCGRRARPRRVGAALAEVDVGQRRGDGSGETVVVGLGPVEPGCRPRPAREPAVPEARDRRAPLRRARPAARRTAPTGDDDDRRAVAADVIDGHDRRAAEGSSIRVKSPNLPQRWWRRVISSSRQRSGSPISAPGPVEQGGFERFRAGDDRLDVGGSVAAVTLQLAEMGSAVVERPPTGRFDQR